MTLNGITPSFGKTHINSSKMNAKSFPKTLLNKLKILTNSKKQIKIMLIYTFFQKAKNL